MPARIKKNSPLPDSMFKPLEKKRYSEQIADLIQSKILTEHIETGTGLPTEKDLALEFQVSRSVIREALRILEISGLVSIKKGPTGGIFVADIYHKPMTISLGNLLSSGNVTIDDIFNVRLLIEPYIAANAALNAKEKDILNLKELISDSEERKNDSLALKNNNLGFHILLARACGNPILGILVESLFELLAQLSFDFRDLEFEIASLEIHKKILIAIEGKQAEEAKKLIQNDILGVKEKLEDHKK